MNIKNKLLFQLTKKIILRNQKFKDLHKGESCYLLGNARSLKYYDLSFFKNKISIGCNFLFLHKDFKKIGINYYYNGDPFFCYPYRKNIYSGNMEKNILGNLYTDKVRENSKVDFFINISDYPMLRGKNIFYLHHFGKKFTDFSDSSLDGIFNSNQNALSGMLGMAIFLGFKDITLVGFDHLLLPKASQHFYELGELDQVNTTSIISEKILNTSQKFLKLRVVTPNDNYKGHIIPHISYEELTGLETRFKENTEIIAHEDLVMLSQTNYQYNIF